MKRIALTLALLMFGMCLLNGCGTHKHDYQERDGRVVCLDCKEVCTHNYEISGSNAYCSNCLYSCKHSFTENNGDMICDLCKIVCTHDYDKNSICKYCEKECIHEYESTATGGIECKNCHAACEHIYELSDGNMICKICGTACTHDYDENSLCKYCKTKCIHEYESTQAGTICKICHASCEHVFGNSDGKTVCKICGVTCNHKFGYFNGAYKCKFCGTACNHEFNSNSGKSVCKKCGKERFLLTASNANEYFTVNVKVYDVVVKKDYLLGTKDMGEGRADITVSSKKDVKYKNVVVTVLLETTSTGWLNQSREVEISFDGHGQKSTNFTSKILDYVSDSPVYRASIKSVSGEIEM